jgi:2,5-dihydroxypyridine 5,6-dioxygenase
MLSERITRNWIQAFRDTFELCRIKAGDPVAILSESLSRQCNVLMAELALAEMGAIPFHIHMPSLPAGSIPIRSTGASQVLRGLSPVVKALGASTMVADLTVEGILHAPDLPAILQAGARCLYISNDHPEILERCKPDRALRDKVIVGSELLRNAKHMRVKSAAGTDLSIEVAGSRAGGNWGVCEEPGSLAHWPGGLIACFPRRNSVNGILVLDAGDINLTFKKYIDSAVTFRIENDYVKSIEGKGYDAEMMRAYYAAWNESDAYAVSHVGWGMNPGARWDSFTMYDKGDTNGTEQRAYAGNFLYSTGANLFAQRETICHFDLPVRNCTITVDDVTVVQDGQLNNGLFEQSPSPSMVGGRRF